MTVQSAAALARKGLFGDPAKINFVIQNANDSCYENQMRDSDMTLNFTTKEAVKAMHAGELPDGATVRGGFFSLRGDTGVTALPNDLTVEGILDLVNCKGLKTLPRGLTVGFGLNLCGCTGLTALPDDLMVEGLINLGECRNLACLPAKPQFGGGVFIVDCEALAVLPEDWTVYGDLEIYGTNGFTALPEGLTVKGTLKMIGQSQLTRLPEKWRVGDYLIIDNCYGLGALNEETLKAQTSAFAVRLYDPLIQDE